MPDVQRQYEYAEKKDQMRQKDIERKEKKRVGLFGSFVGALEAGAALVEKGIHEASNQIDTSAPPSPGNIVPNLLTEYIS